MRPSVGSASTVVVGVPRPPAHDDIDEVLASLAALRGSLNVEEYGRFQQHLVLLEDSGRLNAYWEAIRQTVPGETVVDVGAGTGVLALMALRHGFEKAVLIEPSRKIAAYAKHLARLNGMESRVSVIEANLEHVPSRSLPDSVDLMITETISSLLFGFGSWDAMSVLLDRLSAGGHVIPERGWVFAIPVTADLATRGSARGGLRLLSQLGLEIDLFQRTFRSGGNVYDTGALTALLDGHHPPELIARFDLTTGCHEPSIPASFKIVRDAKYWGVLTFWEAELATRKRPVTIGSLDPAVSSWYPYYIPFKQPVLAREGTSLCMHLTLRQVDTPYPYAFQLMSGNAELTHVLYW